MTGFPWLELVIAVLRVALGPAQQPIPRPVLRPPAPATQDRAELLLMAAALQPPRPRTCGNPACPHCTAHRRNLS